MIMMVYPNRLSDTPVPKRYTLSGDWVLRLGIGTHTFLNATGEDSISGRVY